MSLMNYYWNIDVKFEGYPYEGSAIFKDENLSVLAYLGEANEHGLHAYLVKVTNENGSAALNRMIISEYGSVTMHTVIMEDLEGYKFPEIEISTDIPFGSDFVNIDGNVLDPLFLIGSAIDTTVTFYFIAKQTVSESNEENIVLVIVDSVSDKVIVIDIL